MPMGGVRFGTFVAVSLLAHGALLPVLLPVPGWQAPVVFQVTLRESAVVAAPPSKSASPPRRAIPTTPAQQAIAAAPELAIQRKIHKLPDEPLKEPLVEPLESVSPEMAQRPEESPAPRLSASTDPSSMREDVAGWKVWGASTKPQYVDQTAPAEPQEVERWRRDAQWRTMAVGAMWMEMYQRLSMQHPEQDGMCRLHQSAGFQPECDAAHMHAWSEQLQLIKWAARLSALHDSLQQLQLKASQGRLHLQAVSTNAPEAAASAMVDQAGYDGQR